MRHLVELGHRRIAVIRGPEELSTARRAGAGVQQAAAKAGIKLDKELVLQLPSLVDPARDLREGWTARGECWPRVNPSRQSSPSTI